VAAHCFSQSLAHISLRYVSDETSFVTGSFRSDLAVYSSMFTFQSGGKHYRALLNRMTIAK